jgi:hypothetical protein
MHPRLPHPTRIAAMPLAVVALAASTALHAQSPTPASFPVPPDTAADSTAVAAPVPQPASAPVTVVPVTAAPVPVAVAAAEVAVSQWHRPDSVALAIPEGVTHDLDALSHALTDGLSGDREKIRAIYRWVTENIAYDVEGMNRMDRETLQGPQVVLRRRRAVCDGFSMLLGTLALRAGLQAEFVAGHAKGLGVEDGEGGGGHSWVAVKVDGAWALTDPTWGAGDIIDGHFVRRVRDFFFLTPPEKLIWTHLPRDSRWQLLPQRVSDGEFRRQPLLPRDFFELGFSPDAMHAAATAPGFTGFAGVFPVRDRTITVSEAPVVRDLAPGSEYTVSLQAPGADSVTVVSGTRWTPLARDGDRFSARFTPAAGDTPLVMVSYPGEAQPRVILQYATARRER